MPAGEWVVLDDQWSRVILHELPPLLKDVRSWMRAAGLEYRDVDGRVSLRVARSKERFVYVKPLQRSNNVLRGDAQKALATGIGPGEMDTRDERGRDLPALREAGLLAISNANMLQYELWANGDPLPILRQQASEGMRIYRVGSCDGFFLRTRFFEVVEELAGGTPPEQLKIGLKRVTSMVLSGRWQILPGSLVCFPLTAHHQPLAALVTTRSAAEVAVLPPAKGTFERASQLPAWPVGTVGASLKGPGTGVYRSDISLTQADAAAILRQCLSGANEMLRWFLDPAYWQTPDGVFDPTERWIAWGSVLQAFEALIAIADDWSYSSSLWDAFRALGILHGIWLGTRRPKELPLREMLRPSRLRDYAVVHIPDPILRDWTLSIVRNWEDQLVSKFPGADVESALLQVEDMRNLIHGVGAATSRRSDRLNLLRTLAVHEPSLQLLPDLAVAWWSAALFAPSAVCRPGQAPWEARPDSPAVPDREIG